MTFTVTAVSAGAVTISAAYNGVTMTANLTVNGAGPVAALSAVSLSASSVVIPNTVTGTVTLTAGAPSGERHRQCECQVGGAGVGFRQRWWCRLAVQDDDLHRDAGLGGDGDDFGGVPTGASQRPHRRWPLPRRPWSPSSR